jgi:hypothetical protein
MGTRLRVRPKRANAVKGIGDLQVVDGANEVEAEAEADSPDELER